MVVNIYDLPATGRKEDVADQASTYLLLRPVDGKIDAASINAVKNTARLYKDSSEENGGEIDDSALADAPHPTAPGCTTSSAGLTGPTPTRRLTW